METNAFSPRKLAKLTGLIVCLWCFFSCTDKELTTDYYQKQYRDPSLVGSWCRFSDYDDISSPLGTFIRNFTDDGKYYTGPEGERKSYDYYYTDDDILYFLKPRQGIFYGPNENTYRYRIEKNDQGEFLYLKGTFKEDGIWKDSKRWEIYKKIE